MRLESFGAECDVGKIDKSIVLSVLLNKVV